MIITTRHLVSHLSGIRHYKEAENKDVDPNCKKQKYTNEFLSPEYLIKDHYQSVVDSLKLFKDDPVVFKPGDDNSFAVSMIKMLNPKT